MRDVLLGLRHALADDLHHAGRLDELRPRLPRRLGEPRGLEALHLGLLALRRLRRLDVGLPVGLLGATALDRRPHVALDDAARGSRAFYLGEVEVVLLRQASNYRRGAKVTVGPAVGLGLGGRLFPPGGLGLRGGLGPTAGFTVAPFFGLLALGAATGCSLRHVLALTLDKGYGPADGDVLPLVGDELGERAGVLGLQLQRNLVGLDLGYRVALGDLVTLALQPLDEGTLLHRVAHLGHDHFGHLTSPPCKAPDGPRSPPAARSGRPQAPGSARTAPGPPPRSPSLRARPDSRKPCPG